MTDMSPEEELEVEEIEVPEVPEPDEPEEGVIDPEDTHVEGVDVGIDLIVPKGPPREPSRSTKALADEGVDTE